MTNQIQEKEKIIINEKIIKRSKFIFMINYVTDVSQATAFIQANRKQDASHNCFAYVIGKNRAIIKKSDDGEPSGSSGGSMLHVLNNHQLSNIVCLTIRYFGGIKLGLGPLSRAYQAGIALCVEQAKIIPYQNLETIKCTTLIKFKHVFTDPTFTIVNVEHHADQTTFTLLADENEWNTFVKQHQRIIVFWEKIPK